MDILTAIQSVDLANPYYQGVIVAVLIIAGIGFASSRKPGEGFQLRYIITSGISTLAAFLQVSNAAIGFNHGDPYWPVFLAGVKAAAAWWLVTRLASKPVEAAVDEKKAIELVKKLVPEIKDSGIPAPEILEIGKKIAKADGLDEVQKLIAKLKAKL